MAFPEALGAARALVIEAAVDATLPTLCGDSGGDGAGGKRCWNRRTRGVSGAAENAAGIGAPSLAAGVASSALVSGGCSPALVPGIGATALVSAVSAASA